MGDRGGKVGVQRDLLLATSGLELSGGGRTVVGRLLARACSEYADSRQLGFSILNSSGPPPSDLIQSPARHYRSARRAFALAVMTRQLMHSRPAIVYDHLGLARIQSVLPAPLRSPFLVFLLGIEVWRPLSWSRKVAATRAARLLGISSYTLERARPFVPKLTKRSEVLYLALEDREPQGEADHSLLTSLGVGFLLIVGRMAASETYKGHDQLIDALPLVLQRYPNTRLVVAGDGDDRARLERRTFESGLDQHVVFTGFVSETTLRSLYQRCSAFAMPSRGEGFGLVYLEAMRAGKPCIGAIGTVASEVIEDRETGYLVEPDDPNELGAALCELLGNRQRAAELGSAGFAKWKREFSYARFSDRLSHHLDHLTMS